MSETGKAKAKEHALASGAKPRLEERVREQGWRPTGECSGNAEPHAEAARRRAIAATDELPWHRHQTHKEVAA
jgi:hypothetical protein